MRFDQLQRKLLIMDMASTYNDLTIQQWLIVYNYMRICCSSKVGCSKLYINLYKLPCSTFIYLL